MRRGLMIATFMGMALLVWLMATAPVFAGPAVIVDVNPAAGGKADGTIRGEAAALAPTFFQEVPVAFTATPTTGTIGDAALASRATFSTTEAVEFDGVLFESGLAGTTATLQLAIFDPRGRLVAFSAKVQGAPSTRQDSSSRLAPEPYRSGS